MQKSKLQFKIYISEKGFTLLEMIVAVGIFASVVTIALASLLNLNNVHKDTINFNRAMDNVRFALEMMAKDIRFGENYVCGTDYIAGYVRGGALPSPMNCEDVNSPESSLSFKNPKDDFIIYKLENNQIKRWSSETRWDDNLPNGTSDDEEFRPLTSAEKELKIEELKFNVWGAESNDNAQPKILIRVKVNLDYKGKTLQLDLQTLASSRNPDY